MSSIHHPHPSDDDLEPANKRRKVNTCLQCKARKVKCDKVRPLCGPCRRRRVPTDNCVFADEADPETLEHYLGPDYLAQQGYDVADTGAGGSDDADLLGLQDPQARAVLDRITREIRLREDGEDSSATLITSDPNVALVGTGAIAADAGAVIDPSLAKSVLSPNGENAHHPKRPATAAAAAAALADPSVPLSGNPVAPLDAQTAKERTKLILGLLPNDHVVNVLLDSLRAFESKSPLGISWRLIRIQLINLRGDISDWRTGQVEEPDVDLTFLALLFELMVSAIDCKPVDEIISEGIALTADQVPEMTSRWHTTCQALLGMCDAAREPNVNTVCTVFLFYLYELRRGAFKSAIHHLQSSYRSAQAICMHQLSSAEDDAQRWRDSAESEDTTIRTGAVTAMRKALFEGGESFAVSEEQQILQSLRHELETGSQGFGPRRRELLQTNIPDRTHLVREATRMLWVSLVWHLELVTPPAPLSEALDDSTWTTRLSSIDEAHLSDGETFDLPSGSSLASVSTCFFQFLSASTHFAIKRKQRPAQSAFDSVGAELLGVVSEWNGIADRHLTAMREQVGVGRAMLNHFSLLIHHWTRIRVLRPYFGQLEDAGSSLASSREALVTSCRESLLQVQKITATSDVDLSIFQPVVTTATIDSALLLALHLLSQAESNDYNGSPDWHDIRSLVKTSLLLIWTQATSTTSPNAPRLGRSQTARRPSRQLIEHILLLAFDKKHDAIMHAPRIKDEDGELQAPRSMHPEDRLDQTLGPLGPEDPLATYRDLLLDPHLPVYRHPLFFDVLDGEFRFHIHPLRLAFPTALTDTSISDTIFLFWPFYRIPPIALIICTSFTLYPELQRMTHTV
ncbi:hypothetical protein BCV70DRAFT_116625 [Testicularia cyperi]|uniref:Zn(2)-C6 fungal-type domain-containing protein n=1 Tax=Testicularia cyperi TaxID=1882483 RepID=A0A317XPV4_9BASI|nr:hypothetical protein BCV70DRAFT_116625 [Testicularia cyperi]